MFAVLFLQPIDLHLLGNLSWPPASRTHIRRPAESTLTALSTPFINCNIVFVAPI